MLNREAGETIFGTTLKLWTDLVCSTLPSCVRECSKALKPLVLDGSRPTKDLWKVSYHLVFQWLTFGCNDGLLKELVQELSDHADLQCPSFRRRTCLHKKQAIQDSLVVEAGRKHDFGI